MHSDPLLSKDTNSWTLISKYLAFIIFFLTTFTFLQNKKVQAFEEETPVSGPIATFKQGSPETKIWLEAYHRKLAAVVKALPEDEDFPKHKAISYTDIVARVKQWILWSDDPKFRFYYLYDESQDNETVLAGVGTYIFSAKDSMAEVKERGRREFEEKLNHDYCNTKYKTRPPWKYLDEIFSHDIMYMVGIHKYPRCEIPNLLSILLPYMIEQTKKVVETQIWEFWVPRPLGPMDKILGAAGFKVVPHVYDKPAGTSAGSFSDDWFYTAADFVASFNHFVIARNAFKKPGGRLLNLSYEFSFGLVGEKSESEGSLP